MGKMAKAKKFGGDFWIGLGAMLVGLVYWLLSYTQAKGISDWSLSPGFFPRLSAGFIIALSLLLILVSFFQKKEHRTDSESSRFDWKPYKYVAITVFIIAVYIMVFQWLGYIISTILALISMMILYKGKSWIVMATITIILPTFIYYFSLKIMYVLFPSGLLF